MYVRETLLPWNLPLSSFKESKQPINRHCRTDRFSVTEHQLNECDHRESAGLMQFHSFGLKHFH